MKPTARRLPLPFLPLLISLAALPAHAQPDASWTESGDVTIRVYAAEGGSRFGRDAANVLESDIIDEITVGDSGLIGNQQSGTLEIEGIGSLQEARDLGDVFVLVGELRFNDVFVDGNFIRIGVSVESQFTDLSAGTLAVMLSEVATSVVVRNGLLSCQTSRMDDVTVSDLGRAIIAGCSIGYLSPSDFSETSITDSSIDGNSSFGGTMSVSRTTIDTNSPNVGDGDITLGLSGPVVWHNAGEIRVRGGTLPTDLLASDSLIETQTTYLSGSADGRETSVTLQGATTWRSFDLFRTDGSALEVDVNSASRIDARANLYISGGTTVTVRSGVGTDSRIDVGGDLGLGNVDVDTFSTGTLTIEDGGYVSVDGTLYIQPLATLNLNGGTLRVTNLVEDGTLNRNGGTLIVPEAGATASGIAAALAFAIVRRRDGRRA